LIEDREACETYLKGLEQRLTQHKYLMSDSPSLVDLALLPFIRQFARVERQWYRQSPYPNLRDWLNSYLQSRMFSKVMTQHPLWLETGEGIVFSANDL
ncbi:glutathione S-transferase C-terminal domain-containing protein, partial [Shewanella sp. 0m-11]